MSRAARLRRRPTPAKVRGACAGDGRRRSRPCGASAAFVTAKLADAALVGSRVAFAARRAVAFAGSMTADGPRSPRINGMQYLAIFAQPRGVAAPSDQAAVRAGAPRSRPPPSCRRRPSIRAGRRHHSANPRRPITNSFPPARSRLGARGRAHFLRPNRRHVPDLGKIKTSPGPMDAGRSSARTTHPAHQRRAAPPRRTAPVYLQRKMIFNGNLIATQTQK